MSFAFNWIGAASLATLPERFALAYQAALIEEMGRAANKIVDDAKSKLVPGHGYDTGKLKESLQASLTTWALGLAYEINSEEAEYWLWVEVGHMLRSGDWWEGYHYIETSVAENKGAIFDAARDAFHIAAAVSRGEMPSMASALDVISG